MMEIWEKDPTKSIVKTKISEVWLGAWDANVIDAEIITVVTVDGVGDHSKVFRSHPGTFSSI